MLKIDFFLKYRVLEIFWPILASDPKMLDRLILAGCDVNATLVMNNLVLKGSSKIVHIL